MIMRSCACVFTKIYKPSFLAGNLCPKGEHSMGREKEYRQKLKCQVNSDLKKSIETQLSTEFMDTLSMSD